MIQLLPLLLLAPPEIQAPVPAPAEMRGLWVVRTALVSPASVDRVVDDAQRAGFNALFVQVRGPHGLDERAERSRPHDLAHPRRVEPGVDVVDEDASSHASHGIMTPSPSAAACDGTGGVIRAVDSRQSTVDSRSVQAGSDEHRGGIKASYRRRLCTFPEPG